MASPTKTTADWRNAAVIVAAGVLAAAGLVVTASPAAAQYRSNNDGRALDANKRVGSAGQNDGAGGNSGYGRNGPMVTGNQIITGNVTAGRQFRGPVPYTDPGNFRGVTSGSFSSDRFVRESAGVPRAGSPEVDMSRPSAFYGSGRAAPPPTGYVPTAGATGGYVPTDGAMSQPNIGLSRGYSPTLDPTLRTSELIMPSPDQAGRESTLSASPLYGVRVWRAGESPNDFLAGGREGRPGERADRFGSDPNSIMRMRDELNRAGLGNTDQQPGAQGQGGINGQEIQGGINNRTQDGGAAAQPGLNQSLNTPGQTGAAAGPVGADALQSSIGANALRSSVATGQSIRRNLLVPAERQTPQLARLRQAFERRQGGGGAATDVDAARQFNQELRASRQRPGQGQGVAAPQGGRPGQPGVGPGQVPLGGGGLPPAPREPDAAPAPGGESAPDAAPEAAPTSPPPAGEVPQPERIGSIAEGVEAPGLRDVLKSAEDLMREQKFAEALQKYDVAQRVAPNNALIVMGRANAELGASYYRRAETSLRDAVSRTPELVIAQFDLRALVGEERLQVLVKDLKELAANDANAVRPPLLLAYIAYNTGNEAQAGEYLATAEQRAGAEDPLLRAWRRNWKVAAGVAEPAAQPAPDLNK